MAGAATVSALVEVLVGRLTSIAVEEFRLLWGFEKDVLALKNDFEEIGAVLQDAENKRITQKAVELWLKRLKSASLEVENVIDDISTEGMLKSLYEKIGKRYKKRRKYKFRYKIARRVKDLKSKLDAINSQKFELKLSHSSSITSHVGVEGDMPDRETSSLIRSSLIFGRNEESEIVAKKICNKDIGRYGDDDAIRVFGIWGMPGLGKTTLAQLVYNHERVNRYFELKCWVYVSEKFQEKEIIKVIIKSIDNGECALTELEMLQKCLQGMLKRKKFLIVLDDVWIEDDEKAKWEKLSETLSCGAEGSMVVITTRSQRTSKMMAKVPELQHQLRDLSEADSWSLFEKLAFAQGRDGDRKSQLVPIGREIVKKCKGLPLAVKTLGSLMWSKRSTSEWERVKESNIWELQEKNDILPALKISYDNLLPHLRRCFAYCCLFPKGYEIKKDEMVQLWVSNGFIPPRGITSLYLLAEENFDCLVWRSFFQVNKVETYNVDELVHEVETYKMHDLMHDLAQHVMKDDIFVADQEPSTNVISKQSVLHWSKYPNTSLSPTGAGKSTSSLRSIIMFGYPDIDYIRPSDIHVYLRVLYMRDIAIQTLPDAIWKLKHLRYLNLSGSHIEALSESIVFLQNLQVLLLIDCELLRKLPEGLRYMSNLQCLDISSCVNLKHLPQGIKELTNLRILPRFPIGDNIGAKLVELRDQNNLEGTLEISGLENVRELREARSANLKGKRNLMVLKLEWNLLKPAYNYEEVLEGLEPNPCLKRLEIQYYRGTILPPSWMTSLSNLVEVRFSGCYECENIPLLGRLPNLRRIALLEMFSLKRFHDDSTGNADMFPCLQELYIASCSDLVSLPSNLQKLEVLRLILCSSLVSLPKGIQRCFKNMKELAIIECEHLSKRYEEETGVDWHKISHIPNVEIRVSSNPRPEEMESELGHFC